MPSHLMPNGRGLVRYLVATPQTLWLRWPAVLPTRSVWNETLDRGEAAKAESFYDSTVEKYAVMPIEVLTLRQMLHFGRNAWNDPQKVLKSARFVQRELPKRLARRLLDLQLLPYIVVTNPHIKKVYNAYYHAFNKLRTMAPVTTMAANQEFVVLLKRLVDEHAPMLDALATGLRECKSKDIVGNQLQLDSFLDNMLRSRISRRVIAEQHLHINNRRPGYIGIICTDLDINDAIEFAGQRTAQLCTETYGMAPELRITGDLLATLPYIPAHMDYVMYELLKNAMRAVVERHIGAGHAWRRAVPPIQVRICAGTTDVTIKICDQGGGIPPEQTAQVWSYGYTTIPEGIARPRPPALDPFTGGPPTSASGPSSSSSPGQDGEGLSSILYAGAESNQQRFKMAGLGFGLPLSRLYARYFGGDLRLQPIPGYGTDVYLTLARLDDDSWREQVDEVPEMMQFRLPHAVTDSCQTGLGDEAGM